MVLLLVFMQLARDLFAIAKFLLIYALDVRPSVKNALIDPVTLTFESQNSSTSSSSRVSLGHPLRQV